MEHGENQSEAKAGGWCEVRADHWGLWLIRQEEEGSILGVRWTVGLGGEAGRVSGSQSGAAMPSSLMVGHVEAALLVPF